jgi:4,5-DOPA dioxygenase extradiol
MAMAATGIGAATSGGAMAATGIGAATGGGTVTDLQRDSKTKPSNKPAGATRMPVIFAAHGNPMFMDDALFMNELKAWADALPRPKAVLMVSAHWEARPCTIGATTQVPLIYDFSGFPARYYQVTYPSPGAPWLADRVRALLKSANTPLAEAPKRGLDHGAYVPMICMYPKADVPVLQLSLPSMNAQEIFRLGMTLSPLRDEGVLVIGSGFLTHNLGTVSWGPNPVTPAWTKEFDEWAKAALAKRDFDTLMDFQARAPAVRTALPTVEHYIPVLLAAGASAHQSEAVTFPITGYSFGTITKRSVQFG